MTVLEQAAHDLRKVMEQVAWDLGRMMAKLHKTMLKIGRRICGLLEFIEYYQRMQRKSARRAKYYRRMEFKRKERERRGKK